MSALKQNDQTSDSFISEEDKTIQMDFEFSGKKESDSTDTRNVIALPKIPLEPEVKSASDSLKESKEELKNLEEFKAIEKRKEVILSEISKLDQYLQEKNKKFQEAKTFVEQYERVVTNKQKYIAESEGERNAILLEVEAYKKSKEKLKKEIETFESELNFYKKQISEAKFNATACESKANEMLLHHNTVQKSLKDLSIQKNEIEKIVISLENEATTLAREIELYKNNIDSLKREMEYTEKSYIDKKSEVKSLESIHDKIFDQYKKLESDFEKSINHLKMEESSWRVAIVNHQKQIDDYKNDLDKLNDNISEKQNEITFINAEIEQEYARRRRQSELTQLEKEEEEFYRSKRVDHEKKIEETSSYYNELEKKCIREQAEVDFLKSKRQMLNQECDSLVLKKQREEGILSELYIKKELLSSEIENERCFKLKQVDAEIKSKNEEAKNFRHAQALDFKEDLRKERQAMLDEYWKGVSQSILSISEEVSNYLNALSNVNLNIEQKKRLNEHIFSLVKYYENIDAKEDITFWKKVSFYVKSHQPHLIALISLCSIASIILMLARN